MMLIMTKHFNLQWFGTDIIYEFPCYHDSDLRKKKRHNQLTTKNHNVTTTSLLLSITYFFFCISKSLDNRQLRDKWQHSITASLL